MKLRWAVVDTSKLTFLCVDEDGTEYQCVMIKKTELAEIKTLAHIKKKKRVSTEFLTNQGMLLTSSDDGETYTIVETGKKISLVPP